MVNEFPCLPAAAPVRSELILFASGAFLGGLLNLIPFVKFDGYLALMSHVDVPRLRDPESGVQPLRLTRSTTTNPLKSQRRATS